MKKIIALLLVAIMCLSFVACNKTPEENKDENSSDAPVIQTSGDVKITKENFDTYFEFVEESFFTKDSSGKVNALHYRHYYKLKDEFNIDLKKSNIEITYNHSYCSRPVSVDFEAQTFKLSDPSTEKGIIKDRKISGIQEISPSKYAILLFQPSKVEQLDTITIYYDDFKLTSVEGTIHLFEENEEHNHSAEPHSH